MNPHIASVIFACGIIGLFVLDYAHKERVSTALWLPVLWLGIAGSRPISMWFGANAATFQSADGSPFDRNVFSLLLVGGFIVLLARGTSVARLLQSNGFILLFLLYCAFSVIWSDHADIAFKRWIKSFGEVVMIMIILTSRDELSAMKSVLKRIGFFLMPLSILLIKYYPALGRGYDPFDGAVSYSGVALDKNMLGKICLIIGLGFCWMLFEEWGGARRPRFLITIGAVILMLLWLFHMANSMTSLSCFVFGNCLMLGTKILKAERKRAVIHVMVATVVLISFAVLFLNIGSFLLVAIGRNPTLTGRTELWSELKQVPVNPIIGAGFESFWLGTRLDYLAKLHWWHPTEAHNGYLEVLLNLGWVGLVLLGLAVVTGYRNILRLLSWNPALGRLSLAYFVVGIAYNYTESASRTLDPVWFIFLLSLFALPKTRTSVGSISSRSSPLQKAADLDWHPVWKTEPLPSIRNSTAAFIPFSQVMPD